MTEWLLEVVSAGLNMFLVFDLEAIYYLRVAAVRLKCWTNLAGMEHFKIFECKGSPPMESCISGLGMRHVLKCTHIL